MVAKDYSTGSILYVVNNTLYVTVTNVAGQETTYFLYNTSGSVVKTGRMDEPGSGGFFFISIDMTSYTDSIYFLHITGSDDINTSFTVYNDNRIDYHYNIDPILDPIASDFSDLTNEVRQLRFGNQRIDFTFATAADAGRNVEIGMLDYQTIYIKSDTASDWSSPVSTKTLYFWYDTNGKLVSIKESD